MDPKKHQSQQRATTDSQPASSHRHHSHQSQIHQTNPDGSYTVGSPIGASKGYGQPNQQPVNASLDHHPQGHTYNMPVVDTYTRSPAGREGGSELIRQTPSNLRDVDNGDRNAARMVQQVVPTLQPGYPYRGNAASGSHGDWNPQAGYQPPPAVPLRNVQDQHRYVHGSGHVQSPAGDTQGSSGFSRSSNNVCKLPDCSRPRFFNPSIQEQLDYCEAHVATALRGYAAVCKGCGRLPVQGNSEYCSRFCAGGGRSAAMVPQGFAPACQECRRAITENMQIYGGKFCSPQCWDAYLSTHSSRH